MHVLRSARGADVDVETREKSRAALAEDIDDATALLRTARRSGVDASRLVGKIDAAQKLLGKDTLVVVDSLSDDGSHLSRRPTTPEPRCPESPPPPPPPASLSQMERVDRDRRDDDDNVSLRSSVAARNAGELKRREEEIRRRNEDVELRRRKEDIERSMDAIDLEILRVRHNREETDAEEEDERRSLFSGENGRVDAWVSSNTDVRSAIRSPPRSLSNSYHSLAPSPSPSEADAAASVPKVKPTPKPRKNLPRTSSHSRARSVDDDDHGFSPVASKKGTSKSKTAPMTKTTPVAVDTPAVGTTPATKKAPKTTPSPKTTPPFYTLPFADSSPNPGPEVTPVEDATSALVKLQSQQFAFQYAVSLRPRKPFDGISEEIDFEHYLKKFERALATPGLSAKLRLAEFQFWFANLSGRKIAHFLLRDDEEAAIAEAISLLKEEYGRKRTTADEMLRSLMAGEKIPQKDVVAVDSFVTDLGAAYYVALDTGRAEEFERKALFDSILENKLPQFKTEWIKKWSKNEVNHGPKIFFADFLRFLTMAVKVAKNTKASGTAAKESKRPEEYHNAGAKGPSSFQSGRISGREFPLLRPTYLKNGENPIHKKRNDESSISYSKKRGDDFSTSQNARASAHSRSEDNVEAKSESYCPICEMPHPLATCPTFLASSTDDRATLCRNKNLCFKCLKAGHMARTCFSKVRCGDCDGIHHTALHGSSPPASQSNGNASNFVPNITTFAVKPTQQKSPSAPQDTA